MRFTITAAVLAFASAAFAQTADFDAISKPTKNEVIPAGKSYTIEWQATAKYPGTVSISLIGGATNITLVPLGDIATGVDNSAGKYEWAVDSALGKDAVYGLQITYTSDKSIIQYSQPFHIKGSSSGSTSSYSSASSTATYSTSSTKSGHHTTYDTSSTSSYPTTLSTTGYPTGNLSTTAGPTQVTYTSTATGGTSGSSTTSGPVSVPTSGAGSIAAGSLAMFGGLAVAVLAL